MVASACNPSTQEANTVLEARIGYMRDAYQVCESGPGEESW